MKSNEEQIGYFPIPITRMFPELGASAYFKKMVCDITKEDIACYKAYLLERNSNEIR